jgi:hypothetical protein
MINMKNRIPVFILLAFASACSTKEHHEEKREWKELDSFHKVIAEVYHPMMDSGNFEPVRKKAAQLADEAERWASASLPERMNNDEMTSNLQKLKVEARSLADEVSKDAPNGLIKGMLLSVHEEFHKIMEAWEDSHHEEGEDEDHEKHDED